MFSNTFRGLLTATVFSRNPEELSFGSPRNELCAVRRHATVSLRKIRAAQVAASTTRNAEPEYELAESDRRPVGRRRRVVLSISNSCFDHHLSLLLIENRRHGVLLGTVHSAAHRFELPAYARAAMSQKSPSCNLLSNKTRSPPVVNPGNFSRLSA